MSVNSQVVLVFQKKKLKWEVERTTTSGDRRIVMILLTEIYETRTRNRS